MNNTNIHSLIFLFLFCFWLQILIPAYFTSISNVELLLLFIFLFLVLNLYNFLFNIFQKILIDYNSELKISIKKEIYFILIYLKKIQNFFKTNLNQYFLFFYFSKQSLNLYKKQIETYFNSLFLLINYLYLNFLISVYLEYLNVQFLLIQSIKTYNLKWLSVYTKLKALNNCNNFINKN